MKWMLLLFLFTQDIWAQTDSLQWLFSQPISVSTSDLSMTYEMKLKFDRKSHIRILKGDMKGSERYVVSKTMAYTGPSGYTEFNLTLKYPDQPLRVWVVDEVTGYAKSFLWQPGTNINAPVSLVEQSKSNNISIANWRNALTQWKNYDKSFSVALNLGPVSYTTEIPTVSTALDFNLEVAPRGTMEYWHKYKDTAWALQFKGGLQQVSIQQDGVFAPPSSDSNLLYSGESRGWYKLNRIFSLSAGLKYQREVFLARETENSTTVAVLQEQDLGKLLVGGAVETWKLCKYCLSRLSLSMDTLLFSSGDREFADYLGAEASYEISWRWRERWRLEGSLGYRQKAYSYTAVDSVSSASLSTESQTSELSLGLGAGYLF